MLSWQDQSASYRSQAEDMKQNKRISTAINGFQKAVNESVCYAT